MAPAVLGAKAKDWYRSTTILWGQSLGLRNEWADYPMFHNFKWNFLHENRPSNSAWPFWRSFVNLGVRDEFQNLPVELRSPVTEAWSLNREMAMQYKEVWILRDRMASDWSNRQVFFLYLQHLLFRWQKNYFSTSVALVYMSLHGSIHGIVKIHEFSSQKYLNAMMRLEKIRLYRAYYIPLWFPKKVCVLYEAGALHALTKHLVEWSQLSSAPTLRLSSMP